MEHLKVGDVFESIASKDRVVIQVIKGDIIEGENDSGGFESITREALKDDFFRVFSPQKREEARDYDYINPNHYKKGDLEVWEQMVKLWGVEAFVKHCEMCAFKYRMRMGAKPEQPIERDLKKAEWYEAKANELRFKEGFVGLENITKAFKKASDKMK